MTPGEAPSLNAGNDLCTYHAHTFCINFPALLSLALLADAHMQRLNADKREQQQHTQPDMLRICLVVLQ
jgi:hypothetical protein